MDFVLAVLNVVVFVAIVAIDVVVEFVGNHVVSIVVVDSVAEFDGNVLVEDDCNVVVENDGIIVDVVVEFDGNVVV